MVACNEVECTIQIIVCSAVNLVTTKIQIMAKFRKKPVVIEAIQLNKTNVSEVLNFIAGQTVRLHSFKEQMRFEQYEDSVIKNGMDIHTLEDGNDVRAKHVATIGDWIIKGVNGEFYPCKPDIFEKTYEAV